MAQNSGTDLERACARATGQVMSEISEVVSGQTKIAQAAAK
jgi:hypothetical protein